ncbi:hypothetical protein [Stutzerimonas urumqiensis]|uniref:hypothetical protein n=1 Tax=Stutzerimonas urumqiensis TaxID=638269 RepID=UPI000EAF65FB|nr:hypothetical protein [Stutzerimonas urumqiensis]
MTVVTILRDAWFFYRRHFLRIAMLCMPLILAESLARHLTGELVTERLAMQDLLIGLLFYPLYSAALILYLDARSRGHSPTAGQLYSRALALWPRMALLSAIASLLILFGASLFVLPGIWIMVKIAFAEYLLVLEGRTPLRALADSMRLTQGRFLLVLGCALAVLVPLWALDIWLAASLPDAGRALLPTLALDALLGVVQLFATVVMFRCFMLSLAAGET